ncbi:MAG: glycosyltransferase [Ruminococcaceae bacterium]|nr:glycosyltransferase [Oscillospiraceae bacterium]
MHILQVNCFYDRGSTGRIVADIRREAIAAGHTVTVCYGRHTAAPTDGVYKVSSEREAKVHALAARLWGVEFGFSPIATARVIRRIRDEKPDVVHLHCLNGHFINVYRLVRYLKKHHIRTVLTLHAEIMHTAGCEHALSCEKWTTECHRCPKIGGVLSRLVRDDARHCFRKMKAAFDGFAELTVVGVSAWLTARAARSPIFQGARFASVGNGVNTAVFMPQDTAAIAARLALRADEKMVLYVTPSFARPLKGGGEMLEMARRLPQHRFVIVGFDGDATALPANVTPIAHTQDATEMAAFYTLADVTLLTSVRETFSMVTAESLCCGTPVVGYEAGAPETIALPDYSTFVPQGDRDALEAALRTALSTAYDSDTMVAEAQKTYATAAMTAAYLALYTDHT